MVWVGRDECFAVEGRCVFPCDLCHFFYFFILYGRRLPMSREREVMRERERERGKSFGYFKKHSVLMDPDLSLFVLFHERLRRQLLQQRTLMRERVLMMRQQWPGTIRYVCDPASHL